MTETFEIWLREVEDALRSINMTISIWQPRWAFDFHAEYNADTKADDAAMKANRFWWREQNKALKQDCQATPNCWLRRGHKGVCKPV